MASREEAAAPARYRGASAARFRAWRVGSAGEGREEEGVAVLPPARRRAEGGDLGRCWAGAKAGREELLQGQTWRWKEEASREGL